MATADKLTQDMAIIKAKIDLMDEGDDKDTLQTTYEGFVERKTAIDNETPQTIDNTVDSLATLAGEVKSVADSYRESNGGRRRKYSRRGRRSAKKSGGTRRKQKRRQRRGSRRAY